MGDVLSQDEVDSLLNGASEEGKASGDAGGESEAASGADAQDKADQPGDSGSGASGSILSQDEVNSLLQGIGNDDVKTRTSQPEGHDIDSSAAIPFNFANQDRIIRDRMPGFDFINDRFTRLFRGSLFTVLQKAIDISVVSSKMIKFSDFLKTIPVPTSLNTLKMNSLRGLSLLIIEAKLVFYMVDNFLGGQGLNPFKVEGREFTMIEQRVISKIVNLALRDLEEAWKPIHSVSFQYTESEVNPQFVRIIPMEDLVVVVDFELELDSSLGVITFCLPYSAIEPIREKLRSRFQDDEMKLDHQWISRMKNSLKDVPLNIAVELGKTKIDLEALLNFKIGDVIITEQDVESELTVKIEDVAKFKGYSGLFRGSKSLQISSVIR